MSLGNLLSSVADSVCLLKIVLCCVLLREFYLLADSVKTFWGNGSERDFVTALQFLSWLSFSMLFRANSCARYTECALYFVCRLRPLSPSPGSHFQLALHVQKRRLNSSKQFRYAVGIKLCELMALLSSAWYFTVLEFSTQTVHLG
jgi:hypothetical protein